MLEDMEWLNDQAGLMIRSDERTWVKAGVEYSDGALQLSTVMTNGTSDWTLSPLEAGRDKVTMRLTRQNNAVHVQYLKHPGLAGQWTSLRLGYLQTNGPVSSRYDGLFTSLRRPACRFH